MNTNDPFPDLRRSTVVDDAASFAALYSNPPASAYLTDPVAEFAAGLTNRLAVDAARHLSEIDQGLSDVFDAYTAVHEFQRQIEAALDLSTPPVAWDRQIASWAPQALALGQRGWTFPVRTVMTQFAEIVEQDLDADALDSGWVQHYADEGGAAFEELVDALEHETLLDFWRPMLREAIAAYRAGWFLVAVPALLACLEGALAMAVEDLTVWRSVPKLTAAGSQQAHTGVQVLCWASLNGLTGELFQRDDFADPPPDRLNRHRVLHGRMLPPDPQADCLRLLQALETLALAAWRKFPRRTVSRDE
jgi:hypothetical protein